MGVKELNGKVENTHKQDDREFYSQNSFSSYESIALNTRGYNERWNTQRSTKALGWQTPEEVVINAYIKAIALLLYVQNEKNTAFYKIDGFGNTYLPIPKPQKIIKTKNKPRKISAVGKYLQYLEWLDKKSLKCLTLGYPTNSQNFSGLVIFVI